VENISKCKVCERWRFEEYENINNKNSKSILMYLN